MKILGVSDFHNKPASYENFEGVLSEEYDIVLLVGDLTQFGPPSRVKKIFDVLDRAKMKFFAIPGNCDPEGLVSYLEKRGVNLHSNRVRIEGLTFVGLGGSNETPFDTPFEMAEGEIERRLEMLTEKVEEDWVLVTHAPPYDTDADLTSDGDHAGSRSIRRFIEEYEPLVNFCGHIHEAPGVDKIGETFVMNLGSISEGFAGEAIIDRDGVEVNMLKV